MSPVHVEHRGYHNSQVAEKWAREHFVASRAGLRHRLERGRVRRVVQRAAAWTSVWPASKFDVLADAGNGVITADFLDNSFPNWNFEANLPPDIPGVLDVLDQRHGHPGLHRGRRRPLPAARRWAHYTTAYDGGSGGQTGFYNVMLNNNDPLAALTWWNGSCAFNAKMRQQAQRHRRPRCRRTTATTSAPARGTRCGAATRSTPTRPAASRRSSTGSTRCSTAARRRWSTPGRTSSARTADCCCRATSGRVRYSRRSSRSGPDVKIVCDGGSPSGAFIQ